MQFYSFQNQASDTGERDFQMLHLCASLKQWQERTAALVYTRAKRQGLDISADCFGEGNLVTAVGI